MRLQGRVLGRRKGTSRRGIEAIFESENQTIGILSMK
jgi:hypothetical protein